MFTKAKTKDELLDQTVLIVKKSIGRTVSNALVNRIIDSRSKNMRTAMENKVPRIIVGGIGSFSIKQGKNRFPIKKGREYYVRKASKYNFTTMGVRFATKFKVITNNDKLYNL